MATLQRITTQYIEHEDRLRLTGITDQGEAVVLWLSQRLLLRLIPHLTAWLEKTGNPGQSAAAADQRINEQLQDQAQRTARNELTPLPPVTPESGTRTWMAHTVDVAHNPGAVRMTFRGDPDLSVDLGLNSRELRQWLAIVYDMWRLAQWPDSIWPNWITDSTPRVTVTGTTLLH